MAVSLKPAAPALAMVLLSAGCAGDPGICTYGLDVGRYEAASRGYENGDAISSGGGLEVCASEDRLEGYAFNTFLQTDEDRVFCLDRVDIVASTPQDDCADCRFAYHVEWGEPEVLIDIDGSCSDSFAGIGMEREDYLGFGTFSGEQALYLRSGTGWWALVSEDWCEVIEIELEERADATHIDWTAEVIGGDCI